MHAPRATGCSSRISCARIASRCSVGPMEAWRSCGPCVQILRQATSGRIFAPLRYLSGMPQAGRYRLEWTHSDPDPARCARRLGAGEKLRTNGGRCARASARAVIVKYKSAHHYFDRENVPVRQRRNVSFSPDGSGRVTVGSNQEARADAIKRVPNGSRAKITFPARPDPCAAFLSVPSRRRSRHPRLRRCGHRRTRFQAARLH